MNCYPRVRSLSSLRLYGLPPPCRPAFASRCAPSFRKCPEFVTRVSVPCLSLRGSRTTPRRSFPSQDSVFNERFVNLLQIFGPKTVNLPIDSRPEVVYNGYVSIWRIIHASEHSSPAFIVLRNGPFRCAGVGITRARMGGRKPFAARPVKGELCLVCLYYTHFWKESQGLSQKKVDFPILTKSGYK